MRSAGSWLLLGWMALAACASAPPAAPGKAAETAGPAQLSEVPPSESRPSPLAPVVALSAGGMPAETRAIWVTRWDYASADDVRRILVELSDAGFNAVYFQARGTADAYYRSSREPWAARLAGRLGQAPPFDPLQVALEEAKRRGLKLHAWVNACTAWKKEDPPPGPSKPPHPFRAHPEWVLKDAAGKPFADKHGYFYFDPDQPAFRSHLTEVVAELVSNYAVDGVHLDYFRFPAPDLPLSGESERLYRIAARAEGRPSAAQWRRERLAKLLERISRRAHRLRPEIEVSVAVIGIRRDLWGWGGVVRGLDDFHQDAALFAERRALDVLVPMLYWPPTDPPGGRADFLTLARDFAPLKERVRLVAGLNLEAGDYDVLEREIAITRQEGFSGTAFFSYSLWQKRAHWLEKLRSGPWRPEALVSPLQTDYRFGSRRRAEPRERGENSPTIRPATETAREPG